MGTLVAALGAPRDGLVADRRVRRVMCSRKTRWHPAVICAAALSAILLACNIVMGDRSEDSNPTDVSDSVPPPNSYTFVVYSLEQTARQVVPNGTVFLFDEDDLPFEIGSVSFGDFRQDSTYQATYYGCSGLLMNATGTTSAVTLYECGGKMIVDIGYHGQDPVVIGSEVRYDSYTAVQEWTGTDLIVMDWIDGRWAPSQGIFVEHSSGVVFTDAKLYVMVFEPSSTLEVAEFPLHTLFAMLALAVVIVRTKRTRSARTEMMEKE